jgi:hypothetical protein
MRTFSRSISGVIVGLVALPAMGGLVVTSYETVALTNGYAPSFNQYYSEQIVTNLSPAVADVSGDWTGPNVDGTPNTWHFVGSSRATSTTTITPDTYSFQAAGSYAYELNTNAAFVNPAGTVLTASGAATYRGIFESDAPLSYTLTADLIKGCRVSLIRVNFGIVFNEGNFTTTPRTLSLAGTLPAGRYQIFGATGLSAPNLTDGVHHFATSGNFENLLFSARIPEPGALGLAVALGIAFALKRHAKSEVLCRRLNGRAVGIDCPGSICPPFNPA